jgi:lipopolysaccharide heptosyltransferase II
MENNWNGCKNILCIRPDNMGDLIMSGPAIRALKQTFNAKITVLTSSAATAIAAHMPGIDEVITFDLPWVKHDKPFDDSMFYNVVQEIKNRNFDAAVVFTVYSQNPLPAVMLAYLAGIPKRLAYCRENPYQLLTHWVPDHEPYKYIRHQVRRDMELVTTIGAATVNQQLYLQSNTDIWLAIEAKLTALGLDIGKKWLILHAGVSEAKREYPAELWIESGKKMIQELGCQLLLTGSNSEKQLTDKLQSGIGADSFSAGGLFNLDEFITLIGKSPVMVSVNTGTIHIAAALGTPVVVLYALTNPQHTPWQAPCKILPFPVALQLQSKNEVIRHVNEYLYSEPVTMPQSDDILNAVMELLKESATSNQETLFGRRNQVSGFI